jgi:hypothetical protein
MVSCLPVEPEQKNFCYVSARPGAPGARIVAISRWVVRKAHPTLCAATETGRISLDLLLREGNIFPSTQWRSYDTNDSRTAPPESADQNICGSIRGTTTSWEW